MNSQIIEQEPGESRADYVVRVNATLDAQQFRPRRQMIDRHSRRLLSRVAIWLLRRWLLWSNLGLAGLLLAAFASPLLLKFGANSTAIGLFNGLTLLCDQVPTHSFYIAGYQVGLCQRCLAIYAASLLLGLLYVRLRAGTKLRPLPWRWVVLMSAPLVLDGATQLLGWRQSDILLRTITGALFGAASTLTIYPWIDAVKRMLIARWGISDSLRTRYTMQG